MAGELCCSTVANTVRYRETWLVSTTTSMLGRVIAWLRAGYPEGVPGPDRVPLLALLRATPLTDDQIREVVRNITADPSAIADGVIDHDEIEAFISEVTHHDAGPENIRRVAAKLAAAGWPLAGLAGESAQGAAGDAAEPKSAG